MHLARTRSLFFLAFLACALIVGAAVYLGHLTGSDTCPLCFVQRALMSVCSAICLFAIVHQPGRSGWRGYSGGLFFIASLGAAVAARQVWLQESPPDNLASCLENLKYLLDTQPFWKVLYLTLIGAAGCSEINWTLFGISVPEWSLLAFSGLMLFSLYYVFIEFRRARPMDTGTSD
ncbi:MULTISPECIES: disulfide bond formation protein B [unclassified Pseudomonas]|uniref:disulfide bond formation protein B n=1 Tax=unclassified Pseudomonas TaxID=196821 RepID=UPI0038504772